MTTKRINGHGRAPSDFINRAFVELEGDTSVGIWPTLICINDIGFDLGCLDRQDRSEIMEQFREKLADAFEIALGDRPSITFEYEQQ